MSDLPPLRRGPSCWHGPQMQAHRDEWIWELTPEEIAELEGAAEPLVARRAPVAQLTASDFPLPTLAPQLQSLRQALIRGRGFSLLRGLPVHRYSERELVTIFFGIGTHLGHARSQNAEGHVLGHVRNTGLSADDPHVRIYQTRARQHFHTDSTDVVGLLCVRPAKKGGTSLLVSAMTVYNELYRRRPDLLRLLLEPIATDRRGEVPEGMEPFLRIPVFSDYADRVTVFYHRQYIESAQRFAEAPRLTEAHIEALDFFDELCNDPELHLRMQLEVGDMQFVYNHAMLHDRTGFEDWPEPERRRHLLRLWLSVPGDRPLPPIFATRYGSVEIGNRGGIIVPGTKMRVPWDQE